MDIKKNKVYQEFVEHRGIVQPIRANVTKLKTNFESYNQVAEIVYKNQTNAIVGYFAAHDDFDPNDPKRTIGFSMVRPIDYANADISISKIKAIAMSMEKTGKKRISNSALSKQFVIDDHKYKFYDLTYVFSIPIRDQFERFVERCKRYFKK